MAKFGIVILAVLLLTHPVSAAMGSCYATGSYGADVGQSFTCSFPKFDSSLGTLTQATLNAGIDALACLSFRNDGTEDYDYTVSGSVSHSTSITCTFLGETLFSHSGNATENFSFDSIPLETDDLFNYLHVRAYVVRQSITETYTSSSDLAALTGSGSVGVSVSSTGTANYSYSSSEGEDWPETVGVWTSHSCSFVRPTEYGSGVPYINYTYTPVPEPATMGLLALGGLAAIRRRRTA